MIRPSNGHDDPEPTSGRLIGLGITGLPEAHLVATPGGPAIYGVSVADGEQQRVWHTLCDEHPRTGLWPFISELSPGEWAAHARSSRDVPWPPDPVDHARVLADLVHARRELLASAPRFAETERDDLDADALVARLGPGLLAPVPKRDRAAENNVAPAEWVCLLEAADGGYEIPARLRAPHTPNWMGSTLHRNLRPVDHSAVLQSWHERYGARLNHLDASSIQLSVARPPLEPGQVALVAVEQFAYCDDFDQILGEIDDVARKQVPSSRWYFWWD